MAILFTIKMGLVERQGSEIKNKCIVGFPLLVYCFTQKKHTSVLVTEKVTIEFLHDAKPVDQ